MIIENKTKGTTLTNKCRVANTFFSRLKGLLGSSSLESGHGLLLVNDKSVHTFFMQFAIDIIYIDSELNVIKLYPNMVPSRMSRYVSKTAYILEVPVGTIGHTQTMVGDQLIFIDENF
ncbi:MAG: hypothetical protein B6242_02040 [Anaerolineaceae bacterium 4572_78]|nr:MAG: hypothetical protein B6242_02040 [Anaerolineaceae bacterium 4572_78]